MEPPPPPPLPPPPPPPPQRAVNHRNHLAKPSGECLTTTEPVWIPASCTGLPAASWKTLNSGNCSLATRRTVHDLTLRNIRQDNYLCTASVPNVPITGATPCTWNCRTGVHTWKKNVPTCAFLFKTCVQSATHLVSQMRTNHFCYKATQPQYDRSLTFAHVNVTGWPVLIWPGCWPFWCQMGAVFPFTFDPCTDIRPRFVLNSLSEWGSAPPGSRLVCGGAEEILIVISQANDLWSIFRLEPRLS